MDKGYLQAIRIKLRKRGLSTRAIEQEINKQLRKHKIKMIKWEGLAKSGWMVLDLGNIVIHLMGSAERDYYNLEGLWEKDAIIYHY